MTETTHKRGSLTIEWRDQKLIAHGECGLYHPVSGTLYIADAHIGKASYFRAQGRPVPEDVTAHDLTRLSRLIEEFGASRLVVLGDLFHAPPSAHDETIASLRAWRDSHPSIECFLIEGNHDRRLGKSLEKTGFEVAKSPHADDTFTLMHEPPARAPSGRPTLCGHIHPSVRLSGRGRSTMRSSCFWFADNFAVLPAFGRFTGSHVVRPAPSDRVVAVESSRVIEIAPSLCIARP